MTFGTIYNVVTLYQSLNSFFFNLLQSVCSLLFLQGYFQVVDPRMRSSDKVLPSRDIRTTTTSLDF